MPNSLPVASASAKAASNASAEVRQMVDGMFPFRRSNSPSSSGGSDHARVLAYLMQMAPSFSLRGGTREILRGIIARGLGLR